MLDQQINEQLVLLQLELSRLKTLTDYIDGAKENSTLIISELEKVQQNYAYYTEKIFNLHKEYAEYLKTNTENKISEGVIKFEATGNQIDTTNKEKLVETKRLLEQYKSIVESTDNLVKALEMVDFPARLSLIDKNIQNIIAHVKDNAQLIISKQDENQGILLQLLDRQYKASKKIKIYSSIICGLIIFGSVFTVVALKLM